MQYEIEFIGCEEETCDATAICMRWKNEDGSYTVGVFDGGTAKYGDKLCDHLEQYYFPDNSPKVIDFVICSHPHEDHSSGLITILNNFKVKELFMNRPWHHINDLYKNVQDNRTTVESFERSLRSDYQYVSNLEEVAAEKDVPIYDIFAGERIKEKILVLSPSKDFYLDLILESIKSPGVNRTQSPLDGINIIAETWTAESLREKVNTDPINETSTVLISEMDGSDNFMLTGDAGVRALERAADFADSYGLSIKDNISIYEIPHHGSRHNISPSILNRIVGNMVKEKTRTGKSAFVCTGKESDHPKGMVVNAFVRRGVKVFNASGQIIRHSCNMPPRTGWVGVEELGFKEMVEGWNL